MERSEERSEEREERGERREESREKRKQRERREKHLLGCLYSFVSFRKSIAFLSDQYVSNNFTSQTNASHHTEISTHTKVLGQMILLHMLNSKQYCQDPSSLCTQEKTSKHDFPFISSSGTQNKIYY